MKRLLLVAAGAFMLTANLGATLSTCVDAIAIGTGQMDASGCTDGGLTFSNFYAVGAPDPVVKINAVDVGTGYVNLHFQFIPGLYVDGFTLYYTVTGAGQIGFDVNNDTGRVIEGVCTAAFDLGTCTGTKIGQYTSNGPNNSGLILFNDGRSNVTVDVAYFKKDISVGVDGLSDIVNSHHFEDEEGQVPEPGTYAMMGAGLLALAAIRRRKA